VSPWFQSSPAQTASTSQTASPTTLAEIQAKMREQQATLTTMSNIMRMQYVATSSIIGNMTGGWTYEYRWH
jgi:hypothetical protein